MKLFTLSLLTLALTAQAHASTPDWTVLADRCFAAGVQNFKMITSNPMALDGFRKQLPEFAAKFLGFGAEVATSEITITNVLYNYSVSTPIVHPDLNETVAPIEGLLLVEVKGPQGKVNTTLYSERIYARDVASAYNCYYEENFRAGTLHALPFGIDAFRALVPGMKKL